jgi:hypothetical protein
MLYQELQEYLSVRSVTPEDRKELDTWVRQGFSVHENPWHICFENGRPADYLWAKHFSEEMTQEVLTETSGDTTK